jgi:hypothetical protein
VAQCAEIFDEEVGLDDPRESWSERWPSKS